MTVMDDAHWNAREAAALAASFAMAEALQAVTHEPIPSERFGPQMCACACPVDSPVHVTPRVVRERLAKEGRA